VPPDNTTGEFSFDFTRFGPRVPTVLVSPLIPPNTVFRVTTGTPLDHTSILKTVQRRWSLPALTARDAAAPDFADVLSLTTPRTDDPLATVTVPTSTGMNPSAGRPSHLQEVNAELISRREPAGVPQPPLHTASDYASYLVAHTHL
jgi:phospholipase C